MIIEENHLRTSHRILRMRILMKTGPDYLSIISIQTGHFLSLEIGILNVIDFIIMKGLCGTGNAFNMNQSLIQERSCILVQPTMRQSPV